MKTLLTIFLFGAMALTATHSAYAADLEKYDDHGVTFMYPKGWTVKAETSMEVLTITVDNGKGAMVIVRDYPAEFEPKKIMADLEKTFRTVYEGKVVQGSDKASKRTLAGSEREGMALEVKLFGEVTTKLEYYAFPSPSKKRTMSVVLQATSANAELKKMVDGIADSVAASKK